MIQLYKLNWERLSFENAQFSLSRATLNGDSHDDSIEEIEELRRSTKRVKESREDPMKQQREPHWIHATAEKWHDHTRKEPQGFAAATDQRSTSYEERRTSYRDKLTGVIPGAYEQAFQIERFAEDDSDDDIPPEEDDGAPRILLTRQEKLRIRAPWRSSLIVKLTGKTLEHGFFIQKLNNLWKPSGGMDCVDIGNGFLMVTFHNNEDRTRVLRDGQWFINYRFLTIRMWEPKFNPYSAVSKVVALWIRLPALPSEYYNRDIICKVAGKIGPLLRLDGVTAVGARANFARICVQMDLGKPLPMGVDRRLETSNSI